MNPFLNLAAAAGGAAARAGVNYAANRIANAYQQPPPQQMQATPYSFTNMRQSLPRVQQRRGRS